MKAIKRASQAVLAAIGFFFAIWVTTLIGTVFGG